MLTNPEIKALRKLCEEATPGPWVYDYSISTLGRVADEPVNGADHQVDARFYKVELDEGVNDNKGKHSANGYFIAASRTALPKLLDEVERLQAVSSGLSESLIKQTEEVERFQNIVDGYSGIALVQAQLLSEQNKKLEAALSIIRAKVDEQAEDEGLWFISKVKHELTGNDLDEPITISEAYLQQELRALHSVIEEALAHLKEPT